MIHRIRRVSARTAPVLPACALLVALALLSGCGLPFQPKAKSQTKSPEAEPTPTYAMPSTTPSEVTTARREQVKRVILLGEDIDPKYLKEPRDDTGYVWPVLGGCDPNLSSLSGRDLRQNKVWDGNFYMIDSTGFAHLTVGPDTVAADAREVLPKCAKKGDSVDVTFAKELTDLSAKDRYTWCVTYRYKDKAVDNTECTTLIGRRLPDYTLFASLTVKASKPEDAEAALRALMPKVTKRLLAA
ncbi:hypothetical protein [Longispora albida]|uniref:hypothetical protein n=1 Tax=Longispora albida TaxID=203523 RepID=UPI000365964E|nr:hypothetical protein [Longispora albida]